MSDLFGFFNNSIYSSSYTKGLYGVTPKGGGTVPPPPASLFLLKEDDDFLLLASGDKISLET